MPFCWHSGYNVVPTRAYTTVGTFITFLLVLVYPTDVEASGVIELLDTGGAECQFDRMLRLYELSHLCFPP